MAAEERAATTARAGRGRLARSYRLPDARAAATDRTRRASAVAIQRQVRGARRGAAAQLRKTTAARAWRSERACGAGGARARRAAPPASLGERSVGRVLHARALFFGLAPAERLALTPELLAASSTRAGLDALTQSRTLWASLSSLDRARALAEHLRTSEEGEREQMLRVGLRVCAADEVLRLLRFVLASAAHWGLGESELLRQLLVEQPDRPARLEAERIVHALINFLPPSHSAAALTRLRSTPTCRRSAAASSSGAPRSRFGASNAVGVRRALRGASSRCAVTRAVNQEIPGLCRWRLKAARAPPPSPFLPSLPGISAPSVAPPRCSAARLATCRAR